jgi:hypothetical protein
MTALGETGALTRLPVGCVGAFTGGQPVPHCRAAAFSAGQSDRGFFS